MRRRYLFVLAAASALILIVGLLIKPHGAADMVAPSADESPLRQLSKDADLRNQAELISDRVEAIGDQLLRLPDGRHAVRWSNGIAITPGVSDAIATMRLTDTVPVAQSVSAPRRVRWLVVAARDARDSLISIAGISGGVTQTSCDDGVHQEIVFNQNIPAVLNGGGVYTMSGERAGLVVSCRGRLILLPADDVDRTLANIATPAHRILRMTGLDVLPPTGAWASLDSAGHGLVVQRVHAGDTNFFPGDVIISVDSVTVPTLEAMLSALSNGPSHVITRMRNGKSARATIIVTGASSNGASSSSAASSASSAMLRKTPGGIALVELPISSPLYRAGLRAGDVIVQVDGVRATAALLQRAMEPSDAGRDRTVMIVARRDDILSAHLLVAKGAQ